MNERINQSDVKEGFLPSKDTERILHLTANTLREYDKQGKIETIRTEGNHRRYNVKKYLIEKTGTITPANIRHRVIYARVSTRKQSDNLQRQIEFLREKYPTYELISDIGSGINFKRKGLETILDYAFERTLEEVVVAYKDRLCRFGFDMFKRLFKRFSNAEIVVLNNAPNSENDELADDIITVVTVFSAKINGRKRYKRTTKGISEERKINNDENQDIPK
jgi:predicted site-specific integrase-resolvase